MAEATSTLPYFAEGSEAMLQLEAMVDKAGLRNVLWALQHIAYAKADHIHTSWQDHGLARAWEVTGHKLARWAETIKLD
jgi:hypothetical protein